MPYKLQIDFKLTPSRPISEEVFTVQLKLTNIGEYIFPGGELTHFEVRSGHTTTSTSGIGLQKIGALEPNTSVWLEAKGFRTIEGGPAALAVKVKSIDGEKIDLFQNPEFNMGSEWRNVFPIRHKEIAEISELLGSIVKLLEKREKS